MKHPLLVSIVLVSAPAFAGSGLPPVNPTKSVSALELYGAAPITTPAKTQTAKVQPANAKIERVATVSGKGEYLVPSRPSTGIWSASASVYAAKLDSAAGERPLRMPDISEYSKISGADWFLPEESLDEDEPETAAVYAAAAAHRKAVKPIPSMAPKPVPEYDDDWHMEPQDDDAEEFDFDDAKFAVAVRPSGIKQRVQPSAMQSKSFSAPAAPVRNEPAPVRVPNAPASSAAPKKQKAGPTPIKSFSPAKKSRVPDPVERESEDNYDDEFAYKNSDEIPLTKLSPAGLKRAFKKTFTTENKHLSAYRIDDGFDDVSESAVGFDSTRDLSEGGGVRPLEIKITFNDDDSALSRDNYNLLTEYAGIVAANPKRAVQISISERATRSYDGRKLAARRLAIVEQVLKDSGIIDRRIVPVLSDRKDDSFVLRVISNDTFQTLTEKKRDMFGDTQAGKTYKSMSW